MRRPRDTMYVIAGRIVEKPLLAWAALGALLAGPAATRAVELSGWDSVWEDGFNSSSIDHGRWEVANREHSPNNELQYYLPQNVAVARGKLRITATDQPLASKPYRSGLIRTWQEHRFGRWEVRADLPWGRGMWPAIWLLPRHADWPVGGEIDIMENVGNDTFFVKGSYHYNHTPGSPITSNQDYRAWDNGQPVDFAAGMHDYAVEWDPNQLRFYVDDNLYHTIDNPIQPAEVPMSLIINLAVGGDWPGSPDGSTQFPQQLEVEHARYWTRDETELINPDFDRSGSTINGWNVFGNEIGNVSVQTEAVLDGSHSMKLYGQFNETPNFSGAAQGISVVPGQDLIAEASAYVRSEDSIFGTDNEVLMKLEYYSRFDGAHGGANFLGETVLSIADGTTAEDAWVSHQITGVVPDDAVEARLSFVFSQPGSDGGAVHLDAVSLLATDPLAGDYNGDGLVDAADYTAWRDHGPTDDTIDGGQAGYDLWAANYGTNEANDSPAAVPEPAAILLLAVAAVGLRRHTT